MHAIPEGDPHCVDAFAAPAHPRTPHYPDSGTPADDAADLITRAGRPRPGEVHVRDGQRLTRPVPRAGDALHLGDWVHAGLEPRRIVDLRLTHSGRVVHLDGHKPVTLKPWQSLYVYTRTPTTN